MTTRKERIAKNESVFRDVNEKIEAVRQQSSSTDLIEFVCECGRTGCAKPVHLTLGQYREIREHPARFFVVPGHEVSDTENVVADLGHGRVVEKTGEAKRIAEEEA